MLEIYRCRKIFIGTFIYKCTLIGKITATSSGILVILDVVLKHCNGRGIFFRNWGQNLPLIYLSTECFESTRKIREIPSTLNATQKDVKPLVHQEHNVHIFSYTHVSFKEVGLFSHHSFLVMWCTQCHKKTMFTCNHYFFKLTISTLNSKS